MPWKVTDVSEQRVQFVVRAASRREALAELCREFGVSRPTGYRWLGRFREAGSVQELGERSRRPRHSPTKTAAIFEERVVALRREFGWGAKKLHELLKQEGLRLPVVTINRILKRRGLVREEDSHPPAVERFERAAPNQLWQMDAKGQYEARDGICTPLSILDDHSRYAVGLYALARLTAEAVQPCLVRTFERYGVPEAMLMDHGTPWWSTTNGYGLTWLSVWLIEQGIQLHYGRIAHPQTQGKVERFHRTLGQEIRHHGQPQWLRQWPRVLGEIRQVYNQQRPHEGIGMQRPVERYRRSPRSYQPQPAAWEYPASSVVRRLNSQGCLSWGGGRWFVCEALAEQPVRVEVLEGQVLVSYRHMYLREIDPARRVSRALVLRRDGGASPVVEALRSPSGLPAGLNDANQGANKV